MPTAVEYLPGTLDLKQGVRLADGSVLAAGHYDVQIHFKGWGNSGEFFFLQGGVLKGKAPAQARGFPAGPPAGQMQTTKDVDKSPAGKVFPKVEGSAGTPAFSWDRYGFRPGLVVKFTPAGPPLNLSQLSVDSMNGSAGFSAQLPAVVPARE